jgi:hypothetical protein
VIAAAMEAEKKKMANSTQQQQPSNNPANVQLTDSPVVRPVQTPSDFIKSLGAKHPKTVPSTPTTPPRFVSPNTPNATRPFDSSPHANTTPIATSKPVESPSHANNTNATHNAPPKPFDLSPYGKSAPVPDEVALPTSNSKPRFTPEEFLKNPREYFKPVPVPKFTLPNPTFDSPTFNFTLLNPERKEYDSKRTEQAPIPATQSFSPTQRKDSTHTSHYNNSNNTNNSSTFLPPQWKDNTATAGNNNNNNSNNNNNAHIKRTFSPRQCPTNANNVTPISNNGNSLNSPSQRQSDNNPIMTSSNASNSAKATPPKQPLIVARAPVEIGSSSMSTEVDAEERASKDKKKEETSKQAETTESAIESPVVKRGRGRPRKLVDPENAERSMFLM